MMSQGNVCRLCAEICQDYKSLYDESGNANEVQELMIQYFDENLLHMVTGSNSTSLCMKCWHTISDFNSFQQSIYRTQRILRMKVEEIDIKSEEEFLPEDHIPVSNCEKPTDWNILARENARLPTCDKEIPYVSSADNNTDDNVDDPVGVFVGAEFGNDSSSSELVVGTELTAECNEASKKKDRFTKSIHRTKYIKEYDDFISQIKPSLNCYLCPEKYNTFTLLRQHFLEIHSREKFYITCCQRKLTARCHILEHLQFHANPDVFKCKLCELRFSRRYYLQLHMSKHHSTPNRANETITQNKNRNSDDLLAKWLPSTECAVCKKAFATLTELKRHFLECHPSEQFYVECCQLKLMSRPKILAHVRFHVKPTDFKCDLCLICYSYKKDFLTHMRNVHATPRTGSGKYESGTFLRPCYTIKEKVEKHIFS